MVFDLYINVSKVAVELAVLGFLTAGTYYAIKALENKEEPEVDILDMD